MKRASSEAAAQTALEPKPHGAPYYVRACVLGVPAYLIGVHLWTWVFTLSLFLGGRADFRQLYAAAFMVRTGHAYQLYDYDAQKSFQDRLVSPAEIALPFVRPAYQAVVLSPVSLLPYREAYFTFLAVNVAVLGLVLALLRPWMLNLQALYRWLPFALVLGFLPIAAALIQGQDSLVLTALLVGAFALLTDGREFAGGLLVGLGLFKFQIVIPIALLFVLWRRWRMVLGFLACLTVLGSGSAWLVGAEQTRLYLRSLFSIAGTIAPNSHLLRYPVALQMMANIHGLVFGGVGGRLSPLWVRAITVLLSLATLIWTAFGGYRIASGAQQLLLAIPCAVLVSHYAFIHDLSVLFLPTVVLLNSFLPYEGTGERRKWIGRSAGLMFVAPLVESFLPEHFYLVAIGVACLLFGVRAAAKTPGFSLGKTPWHGIEAVPFRVNGA